MSTEYVETRMVPLDRLQLYPGNARIGDAALLAESLDANGQYRSLIVRLTDDDDLVVLCGNNTLQALQARGDDAARCEIHRCDDATALRINIIDNRANDRAGYDDAALAALLGRLDGTEGTGYTEDEVDGILAAYAEPGDEVYQEPAAPAPPPEFPEVDESLPTEHTCPQCGYRFSGGK